MKKKYYFNSRVFTRFLVIHLLFLIILFNNRVNAQMFNNPVNLTEHKSAELTISTYGFKFEDIDMDGDFDIYGGEVLDAEGMSFYECDENGDYKERVSLQADGINARGLYPTFCDLDNDGDKDLFVSFQYAGYLDGCKIKYYTNNEGVFTAGGYLQADGVDILLSGDYITRIFPEFADIDNDGDFDLYLGYQTGGISKVNYYINNAGIFTASGFLQADGIDIEVTNASPGYYKALAPAFADTDNDGDDDLFIGYQEDHPGPSVYAVFYYQNNGGTFNFVDTLKLNGLNIFGNMNSIYQPTFADLDNDNNFEFYVSSGSFTAYEISGTNLIFKERFVKNWIEPIAIWKVAPDFTDINNDNFQDLILGETYGRLYNYSNNGLNEFTRDRVRLDSAKISPFTFTNTISSGYTDLAFADLDNNGILDMYVTTNVNGGAYYEEYEVSGLAHYQNDGSGKFTYIDHLSGVDNGYWSKGIDFGDIDGDGDEDLIFDYQENGYLVINFNEGQGNFGFRYNLYPNVPCQCISPELVDLDNDGDLDILAGGKYVEDGASMLVFINSGNGIFVQSNDLKADGNYITDTWASPETFDIDSDWDLDLIVGQGFDSGKIKIYINNGVSGYNYQGYMTDNNNTQILANYMAEPNFADLDNDGDLDLYLGSGNGDIKYYENNAGVFTYIDFVYAKQMPVDVPTGNTDPVFQDMDNDGDEDLIVGSTDGKLYFFTKSGDVFSANGFIQADGTTIDVGTYSSPFFIDIDNDGDDDLIVGNFDGKINVYANNLGIYTNAGYLLDINNVIIDHGESSSPTFEDFDNDGYADLFLGSVNGASNQIHYYKNNNGIFELIIPATLSLPHGLPKPTFANFDNGCISDLFVGNENVTVYQINLPCQPSEIAGNSTPCTGSMQTYSVENTSGITYTWEFPTDWMFTNTTTNEITVLVGSLNGIIKVTPSNTYGKGQSQVFPVIPIASPPSQPSTIIGPINPTQNTSQIYSVSNVTGVTYNWTFPSDWVQTAGGTSNSVTVTVGILAGNVTCTPSNSCGNGTASTLAVVPSGVGINEFNESDHIFVFPNPTNGIVAITFKGIDNNITLKLQNIQGSLVYTNNFDAVSDNFTKTLDLSKYPNGMYYLQVISNGKTFVQKIVKQ